jgi:hypothetical protein
MNHIKHKKGWSRLRRPQHETEITRKYTAQETLEVARSPSNAAGIIRPDTGELHVPSGFAETGGGQQTTGLPRVVLVVLTLALIFIAIITYFVAQMPPRN